MSYPDSPPKPQTKICSLFLQQPNLKHLTLQHCATSEHSPSPHSLRGMMGQYLGCFLSQFLSKISCMAASIAWILAASAPYSLFISAMRLSPGLSVGGSTERSTLLCRSWSASTYGSSASSCCCLPKQINHKRCQLLGYQPIMFYYNFKKNYIFIFLLGLKGKNPHVLGCSCSQFCIKRNSY